MQTFAALNRGQRHAAPILVAGNAGRASCDFVERAAAGSPSRGISAHHAGRGGLDVNHAAGCQAQAAVADAGGRAGDDHRPAVVSPGERNAAGGAAPEQGCRAGCIEQGVCRDLFSGLADRNQIEIGGAVCHELSLAQNYVWLTPDQSIRRHFWAQHAACPPVNCHRIRGCRKFTPLLVLHIHIHSGSICYFPIICRHTA